MKVRIGVGISGTADPERLRAVVDVVAATGLDSVWLPELLTGATPDPLVALAWMAGADPDVKLGTTMLLPGRNVLRLAKQIATLDALSGGRFLVTLVPGLARGSERSAVGLAPKERGAATEEAMPLLRKLWSGQPATYHGDLGDLEDVTLSPLPVQDPFEVWSGGLVPSSLDRCGRLFDGWLPAFCTPEEARQGRELVEASAERAGRAISPEHFGVSLLYSRQELDAATRAEVASRLRPRLKGRSVESVVPSGWPSIRALLQRFVEVGFSKFVLRGLGSTSGVDEDRHEIEALAAAVGDLQT